MPEAGWGRSRLGRERKQAKAWREGGGVLFCGRRAPPPRPALGWARAASFPPGARAVQDRLRPFAPLRREGGVPEAGAWRLRLGRRGKSAGAGNGVEADGGRIRLGRRGKSAKVWREGKLFPVLRAVGPAADDGLRRFWQRVSPSLSRVSCGRLDCWCNGLCRLRCAACRLLRKGVPRVSSRRERRRRKEF